MRLPKDVKEFIEGNITFIENNDWTNFWVNWYLSGNDYYLFELLECFEHAEIDILTESLTARRNVLEGICKSIFAKLLYESNSISTHRILEELKSDFGLPAEDLEVILDKAAKSQGLAKSTNGWYSV